MSERYCDLDDERKAECKVAEEPTDEAWLYCDVCHRAMHQGDCPVEAGGIRCAYGDCDLNGDPGHKSLQGWGSYKDSHPLDTAKWPTDPVMGARY